MAGFCLSKRPQTPHSPETALLPRRSQPSQTPGHPRCIRCCVATGASHLLKRNQVGVSKAILRSRNTATLPERR